MTATTPGAPATSVHYSPRESHTRPRGGAVPAVASYERISRFKEDRSGAEVERGVDRQYADAAKAADYLALGAVTRYTDNDRSASEFRTKERERWEELLEDVAAGRHSHVMFWLFDRAFRTTEDAGRFLAACRATQTLIVQTGGWSPVVVNASDPEDVRRMKDAANQAEYEVAKMSQRQRRHKEASADAGAPHGGRRRFGYDQGMTVRESEAVVIRKIVSRFLAGESLRSLAKWLNTEGVPTATAESRAAKGKPPAEWTGPGVGDLLGRPHLAGLRVHHGKVIGAASWKGIIPVETHHHLKATLDNPERRPKGSTNARVWLLTGLATCAECGAGVQAKDRSKAGRTPSYLCPTARHVHRSIELVDYQVESAVVKRLTKYAGGVFTEDTTGAELIRLRDARAALQERLDDYAEAAGSMPAAAYAKAVNTLTRDAEAVDREIRGAEAVVQQASRVLDGATGPGAAEAWEGWDLSRRRAIISELCTVALVGRGKGVRFTPEDVQIRFR